MQVSQLVSDYAYRSIFYVTTSLGEDGSNAVSFVVPLDTWRSIFCIDSDTRGVVIQLPKCKQTPFSINFTRIEIHRLKIMRFQN